MAESGGVYIGFAPKQSYRHIYPVAPSNFYRPVDIVPFESACFVEVEEGFLGSTKYDPILIKEWFNILCVGGVIRLIIPSTDPAIGSLLHQLEKFYPENGLLITKKIEAADKVHLELTKSRPALMPEDLITRFTFGIVTHGKKDGDVAKIIESIRRQKIPEYEIIICGRYNGMMGDDVRFIEFTDHDSKGWITRKKNLVFEHARFENVVVVHDRIVFDNSWYEGMVRYGNAFDALSCRQTFRKIFRVWDWATFSVPFTVRPYRCLGLEYDDWDPYVFMDGGLIIVKRRLWSKTKFDENLFWEQKEDVEFSHRISEAGGVIRFNHYSSCTSLSWRHNVLPLAKRSLKSLGEPRIIDLPSLIFNLPFYELPKARATFKRRWPSYKENFRCRARRRFRASTDYYLRLKGRLRDGKCWLTTGVRRVSKSIYAIGRALCGKFDEAQKLAEDVSQVFRRHYEILELSTLLMKCGAFREVPAFLRACLPHAKCHASLAGVIRGSLLKVARSNADCQRYTPAICVYDLLVNRYSDLRTRIICEIESAKLHFLLGNHPLAEERMVTWLRFRGSVSPDPQMNVAANFYLGEMAFQRRAFGRAALFINETLRLSPDHARAKARNDELIKLETASAQNG